MINVCIVGVSGFADTHYNDLLREVDAGQVRIVAATIRHQERDKDKCRYLKALGCRIYSDYSEMISQCAHMAKICIVPTGIHMHRPMTIAALKAGMHVYVEKPAAGALQDVVAMQHAARSADRVVAVGYQDMYAQDTQDTKKAILDGAIGDIEMIKTWALWPRLDSYYERNDWAGRLCVDDRWMLDSPYNNALAHELIMMLFLAGASQHKGACPVAVEAELYRAHLIESPDTACLRISTNVGIPVLFYVTHSSDKLAGAEMEIRGTKGSILWTRSETIIRPEGSQQTVLKRPEQDALRTRMLRSICRAAAGQDTFYCTLELAILQTRAANGAHEATQIHTLPDDLISRTPEEGSVKTVIKGIDDVIHRAFEEEKLFSEMGVPWAKPYGSFSLDGYTRFG